jgi:glycosyltransferase involved in cell wall biosynthesis
MLRVLHMAESIPAASGGTSTAFVGLLAALRTQAGGVELRAVTQRLAPGDKMLSSINPADTMWTWTGPKGGLRPGALGWGARDVIRSFRPDVVHLHGLWCADLVAAANAGRRAGAKIVWQPHGMLVHAALAHSALKKKIFLMLGLGGALKRADAVIFTSPIEASTSNVGLINPAGVHAVVPLPVRIEPEEAALPALRREGRAKFGLDPAAPVIVFVGRLHPVKRVDLTVAAFAAVRRSLPAARLLLVGEGDAAYVEGLRQQARQAGVVEAIVFAGWLDGADKFRALAAGDVLVFNSQFENFGFAAVEAMNCHTPVVMTENLSLAAPAAAAGAGLSVASDPESLARGLVTVLNDPQRAAMGRRGRAWVEATFSHSVLGAQLVELYTRLARGPQPADRRVHA